MAAMNPPASNPARLHIVQGANAPASIEIARPRFLIGRADECHLQVNDSKVSRLHAEIICEVERYFLIDHESVNGTFVNGQRLPSNAPQRLKNGDEILITSALTLRFEDPAVTVLTPERPIPSRGLWLDAAQQEVYIQRQRVTPPLSGQAFALLELLVARSGEFVRRDEIAAQVWPGVDGVSEQMIDNLTARLRKRIESVEGHEFIVTKRGVGFKFVQLE